MPRFSLKKRLALLEEQTDI